MKLFCLRIFLLFVSLFIHNIALKANNTEEIDSFSYFKLKAVNGDVYAQYKIGLYYSYGRDFSSAQKWFLSASAKHYPPALTELGFLYFQGYGVILNYDTAVKYFSEAADSGFHTAQLQLGYCFSTGKGLVRDSIKAEKYYRLAAEQNNRIALSNMGLFYLYGNGGLPRSSKLALPYFIKSAELGYAVAEYQLGRYYMEGLGGVTIDTNTALDWFNKAALKKNVSAMNSYAWLCYLKRVNINKGIEYIESAIKLSQNEDYHYFDTYASLLFLKGMYLDAEKFQMKSLSLGGDKDGGYLERYGDIVFMLNKKKEAIKCWKLAKELPNHSPLIFDKIIMGKYIE
jgi:hypothetical protein